MLMSATRTEEKPHGVGFATYEIKPSKKTAYILILRKTQDDVSLSSAIYYSRARPHAPALKTGSAPCRPIVQSLDCPAVLSDPAIGPKRR